MAQRRYHLWTIGCQMNRADSYRVGEELEKRGYAPTDRPELADIVVLNTCVVRQRAEDKVRGRLSSLSSLKRSNRHVALVVMGCFVDDVEALQASYPYVDAFLKPSDVAGVADFAENLNSPVALQTSSGDFATPSRVADLVPISYGCDHRCTYCIVALRRGRQRSRPLSEIMDDAESLVRRGTRQITLLGQNVDAYGSDLEGQPDLADVLSALHDLDGLWRIRFLTSHPRDMSQRIIDAVAGLPKVCECWELAVQAGDDAVLRRMGRGYTVDHFRDLVARIRQATPHCAINTDIIVGFPGETRKQFESTLRLVRQMRFDVAHVAAYSPRPGTRAAGWIDGVTPEEKEYRRALVEQVQKEIATEINAAQLGQEVEILVDGHQRGRWRGRTRTNKLVFFESKDDWLGEMARVRITWTGPWSMIADRPATRPPSRATDVASSLTLGLVASKDQPQGGARELEPAPYLIHQVALIREMHQPLVIDKDDKSGWTDPHLGAIVQA